MRCRGWEAQPRSYGHGVASRLISIYPLKPCCLPLSGIASSPPYIYQVFIDFTLNTSQLISLISTMVSPILAKWHKVWDAKSRWEPSIEEKIQNCTLQAPENDTSNTSTRPLTSFRLFPNLLPELRAQIWEMALPGPRCMQVHPTHYRPPGYKAFPHCYGAQNPVILSVNRESRAEALRHLTLRFSTYWNLKIDTLYLEDVQGEKQRPVEQLKCIREGGLLDGFKHLALHEWMWGSAVPEQWYVCLQYLQGKFPLIFIYEVSQLCASSLNWKLVPL